MKRIACSVLLALSLGSGIAISQDVWTPHSATQTVKPTATFRAEINGLWASLLRLLQL